VGGRTCITWMVADGAMLTEVVAEPEPCPECGGILPRAGLSATATWRGGDLSVNSNRKSCQTTSVN
jgi:hypothetical protein